MKFNLSNFLCSCNSKINVIHYILDGEEMVRTERCGQYYLSIGQYHTVKWWSIFNRNGGLELLLYLENPKKKYDLNEWCRRRKFFCEVHESLKKGE